MKFFKKVKNNVFYILCENESLTKKNLIIKYCQFEGVSDPSKLTDVEHKNNNKLYNNITQALRKLMDRGLIESPSRATYQVAEKVLLDREAYIMGEKDLVEYKFISHDEDNKTPLSIVPKIVPKITVDLEEVLKNPFIMEEVVDIDFNKFKFEPLTLKVELTTGENLWETFEVARDQDLKILAVRVKNRMVVVPMTNLPSSAIDPINTFLNKLKEDFNNARTSAQAAERLCKVLMVCKYAHHHEHPLAGLILPCHDPICPIHSVWGRKAKEVKYDHT